MIWRSLARVIAAVGGYSWLPCAACGREFGGHEWREVDGHAASIPSADWSRNLLICPTCTRAGYGCAEQMARAAERGILVRRTCCCPAVVT